MLHTRTYIFLCILLISLAGCQSDSDCKLDAMLMQAEKLMDANPKAAYILLKDMPLPAGRYSRAVWATLITEARNKEDLSLATSTPLMKSAVSYLDATKDGSRYQAKAHYYLGLCHLANQELPLTFKELLSALPYAEKKKDWEFINKIKCNVANTLISCDMLYEADSLYRSIIPLAEKLHDYDGLSICYFQRSRIANYAKNQNYDSIYRSLKKALYFSTLSGNQLVKVSTIYELAFCALKQKHPQETLALLNECEKHTDILDRSISLATKASAYALLNKRDSALTLYHECIKSPYLETRIEAYKGLADLYEAKQDLSKQIYYNKLYDRSKDSLHVSMQTAEAAKAIRDAMLQGKDVNHAEKDRFHAYILISIIGMASFLLLCRYLFIQKRKKHLLNKINDTANSATVEDKIVSEPNEWPQLVEQYKRGFVQFQTTELYNGLIHNMIYNKNELDHRKHLANKCYLDMAQIVDSLFPGYLQFMKKKYPTLSIHDLNICYLYCLGFSTDQIIDITGFSNQGLNKRKRSIKSCLDLDSSVDLVDYFSSTEIIKRISKSR